MHGYKQVKGSVINENVSALFFVGMEQTNTTIKWNMEFKNLCFFFLTLIAPFRKIVSFH